MTLFTQAPLWVWPLLALLVAIGLRSMRERRVPIYEVYAMPALVALALQTIAHLQPDAKGWLVFALVWAGSILVGHRLAKGWVLGRERRFVRLRGEALTLIALMLIFGANFAAGVLAAVAPATLQSVSGVAVFAAVLAAASGQSAGRASWTMRV